MNAANPVLFYALHIPILHSQSSMLLNISYLSLSPPTYNLLAPVLSHAAVVMESSLQNSGSDPVGLSPVFM